MAKSNSIAKEGSHFRIGDPSKRIGASESQSAYKPLDHSFSKPDPELEKRIRSNHFDLGMGNPLPGQYKSVSQAAYDYKGDASQIRSQLDAQRKEDLRASHFKVGGGHSNMRTIMQSSYVDMGQSKSALNEEKKRDLRNSHFLLGNPGQVSFKTTNDIQYKWVQPKQAQV